MTIEERVSKAEECYSACQSQDMFGRYDKAVDRMFHQCNEEQQQRLLKVWNEAADRLQEQTKWVP